MPNAPKLKISYRGSDSLPRIASNTAELDVLHFLSRTLQAHLIDAAPQDVLAKLHNLRSVLDQQEIKLSDWPDSPSKDRMCEAFAKARNLVTQIVDEYGDAASRQGGERDVTLM